MTVFVTAASKHGATREIAEEIARVLDEHGVSTELLDMDDVKDLSGYEAHGRREVACHSCAAVVGAS